MIKRVFLFMLLNLLVMISIQIVYSVLVAARILPPFTAGMGGLAAFSFVYGMSAALISLLLSRQQAKWFMGVKVIDPMTQNPELRRLVGTVHDLARRAGLRVMPEVGIYDSPELNAFATGPSKARSLVAVSSGLLQRMDNDGIEGVLGHEISHIVNGDMVTMTLLQGVVNAFVIFFARLIATVVGQNVSERTRPIVEFATVIVLQIVFMWLGWIVIAYFSRIREFRADAGGARLAGKDHMIHALELLKPFASAPVAEKRSAFTALKISNPRGSALTATHPSLEERIARLQGT